MNYHKLLFLVTALAVLLTQQALDPHAARAASVLEAFAPANVSLTTKIHMQYSDFTGHTDEDWLTFYYHVNPDDGPNGYAFWDESLAPASSSNPNDGIDAQISLGAEFAHPVLGATYTDDTFVFDASGEIRVEDARTTRGHPADGKIIGTVRAEFDLEPGYGGAVHGDAVGTLVLPETNLAPGLTYLDFRFAETKTEGELVWLTTTTIHAPYAEHQFELLAGEDYWIEIEYEAAVPYGSIGSHATNFEIPILAQGGFYGVPEPGTLALLAIGFLCLMRTRIRRPLRYLTSPNVLHQIRRTCAAFVCICGFTGNLSAAPIAVTSVTSDVPSFITVNGGSTDPFATVDGNKSSYGGGFVDWPNDGAAGFLIATFSYEFSSVNGVYAFELWNDRGQIDTGIGDFELVFLDPLATILSTYSATASLPTSTSATPNGELFSFAIVPGVKSVNLRVLSSLGVTSNQFREVEFRGVPEPGTFALLTLALLWSVGPIMRRAGKEERAT